MAKRGKSGGKRPIIALGELADSEGYLLRRASHAVYSHLVDTLAELDLRPTPFSVLVLIGANPGLGQLQVSETLGVQSANFVAIINDLQVRGLLKRSLSSADRRANKLTLTAEGRRVLAVGIELHSRHEAWLAGRLGRGGRAQLWSLLTKLAGPD